MPVLTHISVPSHASVQISYSSRVHAAEASSDNTYPLEFGLIPSQGTYGPAGWHFSLGSFQYFAMKHPCFIEGYIPVSRDRAPCYIEDPAWEASSLL